ncbi:hypothetical protein ROHU_018749 [Labeo rohita]|uniref:Uncharacterized protein n=1 Tax=Labeo rohita TaxID=84645 RepID=A0A498N7N7_LABRO|nr:hypothetical protein ROHU_018749 [Labeo rohita]
MEGNRGVLVEQQIMTEKNKKLQLTVNLSSYETDLLHWQCAVFTENTLRGLAPVTISFTSSTANAPTETSTVTNQEDTMTQDSHLHIAIIVACAVTIIVLILLGLLVFKCQRKTVRFEIRHIVIASLDEGCIAGLKSQEDEDIHYASVTVAGSSQGTDRLKTKHANPEVLDRESAVIYSDIKTKQIIVLIIAPPSKSYWQGLSFKSSEHITLSEALQRIIMPLTPIKIFILICGFCSRFHAIEYPPVQTQNEEDTMTQDRHLQIMIIVACAVIVLILLGLLVFKCQQKTGADGWFKTEYKGSEVDCSTTVIYSASTE